MADIDTSELRRLIGQEFEGEFRLSATEARALLDHVDECRRKIDSLYERIEKGPMGPQKLCDVLNAATAWRKRMMTDVLLDCERALIEAVDAAWRQSS